MRTERGRMRARHLERSPEPRLQGLYGEERHYKPQLRVHEECGTNV